MSTRPSHAFLSVIIPAYNEQHRLSSTLQSVTSYLAEQNFEWDLTIVDDGSSDQTSAVASEYADHSDRIRLLQYSTNRGKGYAVQYGMLRSEGEWRLFMDADNSTSIDHLDVIWPIIEERQCEIVIGSRRTTGSRTVVHQPFWKEALGDLGGLLIRTLVLPGIMDSQAGFKLIRGDAAERIFPQLTLDRWAFDIELLAVARLFGYRVYELPIDWYDSPDTKVTFKAYLEVLRDVFRVRRNLKRGVYDSPTVED